MIWLAPSGSSQLSAEASENMAGYITACTHMDLKLAGKVALGGRWSRTSVPGSICRGGLPDHAVRALEEPQNVAEVAPSSRRRPVGSPL